MVQLLPRKDVANRLIAITLVVLGFGVALAPRHVPGLTLPDLPQAGAAMRTMPAMHRVNGSMPGRAMAPMKGK